MNHESATVAGASERTVLQKSELYQILNTCVSGYPSDDHDELTANLDPKDSAEILMEAVRALGQNRKLANTPQAGKLRELLQAGYHTETETEITPRCLEGTLNQAQPADANGVNILEVISETLALANTGHPLHVWLLHNKRETFIAPGAGSVQVGYRSRIVLVTQQLDELNTEGHVAICAAMTSEFGSDCLLEANSGRAYINYFDTTGQFQGKKDTDKSKVYKAFLGS